MGIAQLVTKKTKLIALLISAFCSLLILMSPVGVYASGESYRMTDANTIQGTGGSYNSASSLFTTVQSGTTSARAAIGTLTFTKNDSGAFVSKAVSAQWQAGTTSQSCQMRLSINLNGSNGTISAIPTGGANANTCLDRSGLSKTFTVTNTANPGGNGDENSDEAAAEEETQTCENSAEPAALRFIACPVTDGLVKGVLNIDGVISNFLDFNIEQFECAQTDADCNGQAAQSSTYKAWNSFRILAYSFIFIALLIIVISHAAGMQMLDAYTIKKALPRLVIAVVFIALSWELLLFIVSLVNDLGHWIETILIEPFAAADNQNFGKTLGAVLSGVGLGVAGAAAGAVYLGTLGLAGTGLLLLTAAIGMLIGWIVLGLRVMIITLGIIVAPVAIACMILPATQKVWDMWRKIMTTALLVFPIIMMLIAAGKIAANITPDGFMSVIFYIAPYIMIPFTFKFAGGLVGRLASITNDKSRGVFDRLRNKRGDIYKRNSEELMHGQGTGFRARTLQNVHRRNALMHNGGWSTSEAGKSKFAGAVEAMKNANIAEKLKNDAWQSTGDDDATLIAKTATNRADFIKGYVALGHTETEANIAAGRLENAFGDMGSESMKLAASRARLMSPTAHSVSDNDYSASGRAKLHNDVVNTMLDMEEQGMARDTIISSIRSNQARPEYSFGHSDWIKTFEAAKSQRTANRAAGRSDDPVVGAELARKMDDYAVEQTDPYSLSKANDRSIRSLAHIETERLEEMKQKHGIDVQVTTPSGQKQTVRTLDLTDRAVQQELGSVMGRLDVINGQSPQKAKILADVLMRYTAGPTDKSMQIMQEVEALRAQVANTEQGTPQYQELVLRLQDAHKRYDLSTTVREVARTVFDGSNPQYAEAQQIRREYGGGIQSYAANMTQEQARAARELEEQAKQNQDG